MALSRLIPPTAGIHAWTAGAIGLMPLAVMTRATLGHTGRPLEANLVTQAIYTSVLLAALARIAASLTGSLALLEIAGALWIAGFAGFAFAYGPLLITRKPAWTEARS